MARTSVLSFCFVLTTAACSNPVASSACADADDCSPGKVCRTGQCVALCASESDCASHESCRDGLCEPVTASCTQTTECGGGFYCDNGACTSRKELGRSCDQNDACLSGLCNGGVCEDAGGRPIIESVDGDGSLAPSGARHLAGGLVVNGQNLLDVTASLDGSAAGLPKYSSLSVRPGGTNTRIELDLPAQTASGYYTLTVANQAGSSTSQLQLLQGEPGQCDASECGATVLPGVSSLSALKLIASADPAAQEVSLVRNGVEALLSPTNGLWLSVLNVTDHTPSTQSNHNQAYNFDNAGLSSLASVLNALADEHLAIIISRGTITLSARQTPGWTSVVQALKALGGGAAVNDITELGGAFVFVSRPGLGEGSAVLVRGPDVARTSVLVTDTEILGTRTQVQPAPAGMCMFSFTRNACPAGWVRHNNADNRVLRGGTNAGATGGSDNHAHGHNIATSGAGGHSHPISLSTGGGTHNHQLGFVSNAWLGFFTSDGTELFALGAFPGATGSVGQRPLFWQSSSTSTNIYSAKDGSHTHSISGSTASVENHTHPITGSIQSASSVPAYVEALICCVP